MQTVLLVIYLMVVVALIGVVLIQRSEGGGLGVGGGSGFMSARGTANALTIISLALGILARYETRPTDILDRIPAGNGTTQGGGSVLDQLPGAAPTQPSTTAPAATAPATPAPAADPNAVPNN